MAKWEKVLYKTQPFSDSYTSPSFLDEVVLNAHVKKRRYWPIVLSSETLVQQICSVAIALGVSFHLYQNRIPSPLMGVICFAILVSGFLLCCLMGGHVLGGSIYRALRQSFLLTTGVYCLSPLLQTLTETVSSDSVVALVCVLHLIHLYFHDYKSFSSGSGTAARSISLGCAVFSSVLISSRMTSTMNAFLQILFSIEMYLLFPFTRRYIQQSSQTLYHLLTYAFVVVSLCTTISISPIAASLYLLSLVFVAFVCPLFLVRMDKFKAKINGPWDEAVPKIPLRLKGRTGM